MNQLYCLDCNRVSDTQNVCPYCASSALYPLWRWLEQRPAEHDEDYRVLEMMIRERD